MNPVQIILRLKERKGSIRPGDIAAAIRFEKADIGAALVFRSTCQLLSLLLQQAVDGSSTLLGTSSFHSLLMILSFSCTIFSDMVFCLLSNGCVVTPILPET